MGNGARNYRPLAAHGVGQPRGADHEIDDPGHGYKLGQEHDGVYPGETPDVRTGAAHPAGQIGCQNLQGGRFDDGAPSRLRFPIGTHHLRQILALDQSPDSRSGSVMGSVAPRGYGISRPPWLWDQSPPRAVLVVLVGTACVSRVDEVAQMQMCDLLWEHDAAYHQSLQAALAIRIIRRKQDTGRFGLYVRIPAGPVVEMLRAYVRDMQLILDPRCTMKAQRGARCLFCDPVWPKNSDGAPCKDGCGPAAGNVAAAGFRGREGGP